jgi:hypothetical protein
MLNVPRSSIATAYQTTADEDVPEGTDQPTFEPESILFEPDTPSSSENSEEYDDRGDCYDETKLQTGKRSSKDSPSAESLASVHSADQASDDGEKSKGKSSGEEPRSRQSSEELSAVEKQGTSNGEGEPISEKLVKQSPNRKSKEESTHDGTASHDKPARDHNPEQSLPGTDKPEELSSRSDTPTPEPSFTSNAKRPTEDQLSSPSDTEAGADESATEAEEDEHTDSSQIILNGATVVNEPLNMSTKHPKAHGGDRTEEILRESNKKPRANSKRRFSQIEA